MSLEREITLYVGIWAGLMLGLNPEVEVEAPFTVAVTLAFLLTMATSFVESLARWYASGDPRP